MNEPSPLGGESQQLEQGFVKYEEPKTDEAALPQPPEEGGEGFIPRNNYYERL